MGGSRTVHVLFFASARELAGVSNVDITLEEKEKSGEEVGCTAKSLVADHEKARSCMWLSAPNGKPVVHVIRAWYVDTPQTLMKFSAKTRRVERRGSKAEEYRCHDITRIQKKHKPTPHFISERKRIKISREVAFS